MGMALNNLISIEDMGEGEDFESESSYLAAHVGKATRTDRK